MVEARLAAGWHGWDYSATTASDGSYAMFGLPVGDYVVRVTAPGYAREYYDNVTPSRYAEYVHVTAPHETQGIDFDLTEGGSISGYVYDGETGQTIPGARLVVRPCGEWEDDGFYTWTASDGSYIVENLALGEYEAMASAEGWIFQWYDHHDGCCCDCGTDITVVPPDASTDINFYLVRGGSASGFVYESDGLIPIQGAWIRLHSRLPNGHNLDFDCITKPDGSYLATDVVPGNYKVQATKLGFATEWYDTKNNWVDGDTVVVEGNRTTTGINFTLDVGGSLTGRVYDEEDGKPISGVTVFAYLTTGEWVWLSGTTDDDGNYRFHLATNGYLVEVNPCNRGDKWIGEWYNNSYDMTRATPVHVAAPDETSGIDFYLARAGSISGHVYEEDGVTPIAGVSVYAFPITSDHPGAGANSGPDGSYTIEGLPSGNYKVQATVSDHVAQYYNNAPDAASATEVGVNAPADTPGVDFRLSRAAR